MATYGLFVTLYLVYVGTRGEWVGPLLWPAVALHAVLTLLLARASFSDSSRSSTDASQSMTAPHVPNDANSKTV